MRGKILQVILVLVGFSVSMCLVEDKEQESQKDQVIKEEKKTQGKPGYDLCINCFGCTSLVRLSPENLEKNCRCRWKSGSEWIGGFYDTARRGWEAGKEVGSKEPDLRIRIRDLETGKNLYLDVEARVVYKDRVIAFSDKRLVEFYEALFEEMQQRACEGNNLKMGCGVVVLDANQFLEELKRKGSDAR